MLYLYTRYEGKSSFLCLAILWNSTQFFLQVLRLSACSKITPIPYEFIRRRSLPLTDPKILHTFWHVDSTYLHVRRVVPLALRHKPPSISRSKDNTKTELLRRMILRLPETTEMIRFENLTGERRNITKTIYMSPYYVWLKYKKRVVPLALHN